MEKDTKQDDKSKKPDDKEAEGEAKDSAAEAQKEDKEAIITMVDSNLQRERISPSEKAFSYDGQKSGYGCNTSKI